jgi:hypothetical protein
MDSRSDPAGRPHTGIDTLRWLFIYDEDFPGERTGHSESGNPSAIRRNGSESCGVVDCEEHTDLVGPSTTIREFGQGHSVNH